MQKRKRFAGKSKQLQAHIKKWRSCVECPLGKFAATHVFHRGDCPADILFIGEAPGADEDLTGLPFVGPAGRLLGKMVRDISIELSDEFEINVDVHPRLRIGFTNILACFPRDESGSPRPPREDEAQACSPRLQDIFNLCRPRLTVLLGRSAEKYHKMLKGLDKTTVLALQHPSHILRNGGYGSAKYDSDLMKLSESVYQLFFRKGRHG